MRQYSKGFAVLFAATVLFVSVAGLTDEVYSWVDENGVRHFGDTPPERQQAEVVQVEGMPAMSDEPAELALKPGEEGELSAAQQKRQDIINSRKESREASAKAKQVCSEVRAELANIEPHRRVYFTNEDGETERMDDVARTDRVAVLRDYLNKNCN